MLVGVGEERYVVDGHHGRPAGPRWHGVVRHVDDVGGYLLGYERKPAVLPGEPRGPACERGRPRDNQRARREPPVAFLVRALADDRQVGASRAEGTNQAINVAANRPAVGRDVGRVNQYPKCHNPKPTPWPASWTTIA